MGYLSQICELRIVTHCSQYRVIKNLRLPMRTYIYHYKWSGFFCFSLNLYFSPQQGHTTSSKVHWPWIKRFFLIPAVNRDQLQQFWKSLQSHTSHWWMAVKLTWRIQASWFKQKQKYQYFNYSCYKKLIITIHISYQ